ncbi:MAG: response regulator transcription factor [Deinococcota bacterium]
MDDVQCILVVDDDPSVRSFLRRGFSLEGYTVQLAASGEEGLTVAEATSPDLVILDLMMPALDGHQTLSRLRVKSPDLPVLLLSGRDDPEEQERLLEAGANAYLIKPVGFAELLAEVRRLIGSSGSSGDGSDRADSSLGEHQGTPDEVG